MNGSQSEHEARICSAVDQVTAKYRDALATVGLRVDFRGIVSDDAAGASEARIAVYEGETLIDSLEFFVRRTHAPSTTVGDVEAWLTEEIERLIADHPWGGGWEEV